MREFLANKGYVEVETPILQPIYGGGFAKPFSTIHNELKMKMYMRISDEM
jgi:lysyl-tRNA synthetase class 2